MAFDRTRRWQRLLLATLLLSVLVAPAPGIQNGSPEPAKSLDDPRLARLRQASAVWELRTGPRREVVDVVCLVPDAATFLEALGTWDEAHWFPILIEDVEYTSKFLRAFRPARIVRYPSRARPMIGQELWSTAINAIGRSWTSDDPLAQGGDRPPTTIRRPPPGIVLSNPDSPSLTGAAALAAGRFQPLVRWEPEKRFGDLISNTEALALARNLEETVARVTPQYGRLGDDCDFLTIALDAPYRYRGKPIRSEEGSEPPAAFDDLIGRHLDVPEQSVRIRWAFTGRLLGDDVRSAYAAMCSLFLQPDRATLLNIYGEGGGPPFGLYRQAPAAERLETIVPAVSRRDRGRADLSGWHEAFAPVNRAGLVLINSSGGPAVFNLGGPVQGRTWDVPLSEPAVVYKVHSFSAANPDDPGTIAGRWLANGAYIYFGSSHEPYLTSFRTPELIVDLMARGIPLGAAVRMLPEESSLFGNSWRLAYLGDPLFRFASGPSRTRVDNWSPLADWPVYDAPEIPASVDDPFAVLSWAVRVALDSARRGEPAPDSLIRVLGSVDRNSFDGVFRDFRDLILADGFAQNDRLDELIDDLRRWSTDSLSPSVRRWLETAQVVMLQNALAADDWTRAASIWADIARSTPAAPMLRVMTERVRPANDQADRLEGWKRLVRATRDAIKGQEALAAILDEELERFDRKAD